MLKNYKLSFEIWGLLLFLIVNMKKWASVLAVCVVACICFILFLDGHIRSEKPEF